MRARKDGECLPVAALRLLNEVAIQRLGPSAASIGDAHRPY